MIHWWVTCIPLVCRDPPVSHQGVPQAVEEWNSDALNQKQQKLLLWVLADFTCALQESSAQEEWLPWPTRDLRHTECVICIGLWQWGKKRTSQLQEWELIVFYLGTKNSTCFIAYSYNCDELAVTVQPCCHEWTAWRKVQYVLRCLLFGDCYFTLHPSLACFPLHSCLRFLWRLIYPCVTSHKWCWLYMTHCVYSSRTVLSVFLGSGSFVSL